MSARYKELEAGQPFKEREAGLIAFLRALGVTYDIAEWTLP